MKRIPYTRYVKSPASTSRSKMFLLGFAFLLLQGFVLIGLM
ncbi:MAG: hypothetical protein AAF694_13545 [Bacteroidota bacterium]